LLFYYSAVLVYAGDQVIPIERQPVGPGGHQVVHGGLDGGDQLLETFAGGG
jgi:hypothetical protein